MSAYDSAILVVDAIAFAVAVRSVRSCRHGLRDLRRIRADIESWARSVERPLHCPDQVE